MTDGGWEGGNGMAYRGAGSFTTLTSVCSALPTTGGWGRLPQTTLATVFPTSAQLDTISPSSVLRQWQWPNQMSVWGSAAFNGFGWFYVTPGAHFAGYMNDTYLIRLADPVAVIRMHLPAPIEGVARRDTGLIVPPAQWAALDVSNVSASPAWGPTGTHQYQGLLWDPGTEQMVFGGDQQFRIENPTAYGMPAQRSFNVFLFNPHAPSPSQAWRRVPVPGTSTSRHATGMIRNDDGTVSFRDLDGAGRYTIDPRTASVTSGAPTAAPLPDRYTPWRAVARDPSTGRSFELNQRDPSRYGYTGLALYETTTGSAVKFVDVPDSAYGSDDNDDQSAILLISGKAHFVRQAAPSTLPGRLANFRAYQVDLTTRAIQSVVTTQPLVVQEADSAGRINGLHGRFAWVPQAGCFIVLASAHTDVVVFRPPASWGL